MARIIDITHYIVTRRQVTPGSPLADPLAEPAQRGAAACTRGTLLQFPAPYEGPLSAAAIGAIAVLGLLLSAGRM